MSLRGVHLGMPLWGLDEWVGILYRPGSRAREYLRQYAEVFNAVEGNTTFYSLPSTETVERWRAATPSGFRFCFKLSREITHDKGLVGCERELDAFLSVLRPLGERLGPFMLQLPAAFGPSRIDRLDRFLVSLPSELDFAVELRHPAFCSGEAERRVNELLRARGCDRVLMDTRPMRAGDPSHPDVVTAAHSKPDLPVHTVITAGTPFVRMVGHPEPEVNEPWLERWAGRVASWIDEGHEPYFFVHVPNNVHSPALARRFHARLAEEAPVGELPPFPGEIEDAGGQLKLL